MPKVLFTCHLILLKQITDEMPPQHLGCDALFAADLGRWSRRIGSRIALHFPMQRGDFRDSHFDVSSRHKWPDQGRRNLLHDFKISGTRIRRRHWHHVHAGQLHRGVHVHHWILRLVARHVRPVHGELRGHRWQRRERE